MIGISTYVEESVENVENSVEKHKYGYSGGCVSYLKIALLVEQ